MEKFIIEGGNELSGSIRISGNKNEALPVIAASLVTNEMKLSNVPQITDIISLLALLKSIGVTCEDNGDPSVITLSTHNLPPLFERKESLILDKKLCQSLRASFLLAAPLALRYKEVRIYEPGGDSIGRRPLDAHIDALKKFGFHFNYNIHKNYFTVSLKTPALQSCDILLLEASVMATEHIISIAVLAKGTTRIYHAACEPHVQGLCHILARYGAKIKNIGSNFLEIEGIETLDKLATPYRIAPDLIEAGSFIGLAAATHSSITITNIAKEDFTAPLKGDAHSPILTGFSVLGITTTWMPDGLLIPAQTAHITQDILGSIVRLSDAPWPGIPADLMSILTVTATQCEGTILLHEKLFESRFVWVDRLISFGAHIILCDPHRIVVSGKTPLYASYISSPDIRAGMALIIAALCASGTSEVHNIYQIDRGYENLEQRLQNVNAVIQRVSHEADM